MVNVSLYMDDCLDLRSESRPMSICNQFKLPSEGKVNRAKHEAMSSGNWTNRSFISFTIRTDYLKVVAVWFRGAWGMRAKSWEEGIAK
eukprot:g23126.t1